MSKGREGEILTGGIDPQVAQESMKAGIQTVPRGKEQMHLFLSGKKEKSDPSRAISLPMLALTPSSTNTPR
jgi:hypothetical protein